MHTIRISCVILGKQNIQRVISYYYSSKSNINIARVLAVKFRRQKKSLGCNAGQRSANMIRASRLFTNFSESASSRRRHLCMLFDSLVSHLRLHCAR